MHRLRTVVALTLLFSTAFPGAARAVTCEQTLTATFAKFVRQRMKLIQRCRELVLTGRAVGPCPDYRTATQIDKARTKLRQVINQRCGGDDHTCGIGGDDVDLASIGWNVARCPGLPGGDCDHAIADCGGVADCLVCVAETAVDGASALVYDSLMPSPPAYELNRCQASIGRSVARYFDATLAALATCEQRDLLDLLPGQCPDPLKAAPRLARAEEKLVNRICGACGSSDDVCGGDDLPPDWIGFPAFCPAVTVPGGSSCAKPVHRLTDLIDCVRCVADFNVGCLDPLSVRRLKPYPGECAVP